MTDKQMIKYRKMVGHRPTFSTIHQQIIQTTSELHRLRELFISVYSYLYFKYILSTYEKANRNRLLFYLNPSALSERGYQNMIQKWCAEQNLTKDEFVPFDESLKKQNEGEVLALVIFDKWLREQHKYLLEHLFSTLLDVPHLEYMLPFVPEAFSVSELDEYVNYENGSVDVTTMIIQYLIEEVEAATIVLLLHHFKGEPLKQPDFDTLGKDAIAAMQLISIPVDKEPKRFTDK